MWRKIMSKVEKQNEISTPYVSATLFLEVAKTKYQFENIQAKAFEVRMKSLGKYYLPKLEDFEPYFKEYLGIK